MGEGKHDSWWLGAFPTSGGEEPPLSHNSKVFRRVIMNNSLHAPVHTRLGGTKPTLAYHGDLQRVSSSRSGFLCLIPGNVILSKQATQELYTGKLVSQSFLWLYKGYIGL